MATVKKVMREVTQEDLDLNPSLIEEGVKVGDRMKLPPMPEPDEEEEEDEEEQEEEKPATGAKKAGATSSITFVIKDANSSTGQSTRVFDEATHGEDWQELAAEFEESNTLKKPVDMTDKEEVEKCVEFNKNIKHQILSKTEA